MKSPNWKIVLLLVCLSPAASAQTAVKWTLDNVTEIGGNAVTALGEPAVVEIQGVTGVQFDGVNDGLLVAGDILNGTPVYTLEMYFYPASGGEFEQRYFHVQEQTSDTRRMLFELRSVDQEWYLDTFVRRGSTSLVLIDEKLLHPHDQWTHIAAVYDGKQLRSYVNGTLELSGAIAADPLEGAVTSIGVRNNLVSWFKGTIAWVKATPGVLTPEQFEIPVPVR